MGQLDRATTFPKGISLNNVLGLWHFVGDPSVLGWDAPVGSVIFSTNINIYQKFDTATTDWKVVGSLGGTPEIINAVDATGGTSIVAGWTDVPLDAQNKITAGFTHTLGTAEITVNSDQTTVIAGHGATDATSGNVRSDAEIRLMIDKGAGYVEVAGTRGPIYSRSSAQGAGNAAFTVTLDLEAGDKVKLQARRLSGTGPLILRANGSGLNLFPPGAQGAQGDPGPPGAGGSISVKDDGTLVLNTPHSILNFLGSAISDISDAGGGQVNIELDGGQVTDQLGGGVASEAVSGTGSQTPQVKLTDTRSYEAGDYLVLWYLELTCLNNNRTAVAQVEVDAVEVGQHSKSATSNDVGVWSGVAGFSFHSFTAGNHTLEMTYNMNPGGRAGTAQIRRARFFVIKSGS